MSQQNKKPSDFAREYPWSSVKRNAESETIALNIMKILERTGDEFRELTWDEYKTERKKDGNFTESEKEFFDDVIDYCKSADTAKLFSKTWNLN